jgi:hypothetical protein
MGQALMMGAGVAAVGAQLGPVKILRVRPTRHFYYLLVRCRCGRSFGHRADRRRIVCFTCGRMADLPSLRPRTSRTTKPKPVVAAQAKRGRTLVARTASRRSRSRKAR